MSGIGIVLNPHSKQHKRNPDKMKRLAFIVGDKGSCRATGTLGELRQVVEDFKTREIDILGIGGGDGTNHVVLTDLIRVYGESPLPKITFLRGGTLNTLAASCGIWRKSEEILSNLIYKYHEDVPFQMKEIDLMKINGEYGFIFGTGVVYRFMKAYYDSGTPSHLHAAGTLAHSILSALVNGAFARKMFERYEGEVWLDGKKWPFKNYSAIYAGSVAQLGLGFKVFYYSEEPGKFHAVAFSLPPRNILRYVPKMFLGLPSDCQDKLEAPASELVMKFEEPQGYTIDGDMLPPTQEIRINIGPRLQVVVE